MTAGPELDRLIAEKVMGSEYLVMDYSTSMRHAWMVVEKLKGAFKLERFPESFTAEFFSWEYNGYAEAETAPLAICLSALKALQVNLTPQSAPDAV